MLQLVYKFWGRPPLSLLSPVSEKSERGFLLQNGWTILDQIPIACGVRVRGINDSCVPTFLCACRVTPACLMVKDRVKGRVAEVYL